MSGIGDKPEEKKGRATDVVFGFILNVMKNQKRVLKRGVNTVIFML